MPQFTVGLRISVDFLLNVRVFIIFVLTNSSLHLSMGRSFSFCLSTLELNESFVHADDLLLDLGVADVACDLQQRHKLDSAMQVVYDVGANGFSHGTDVREGHPGKVAEVEIPVVAQAVEEGGQCLFMAEEGSPLFDELEAEAADMEPRL